MALCESDTPAVSLPCNGHGTCVNVSSSAGVCVCDEWWSNKGDWISPQDCSISLVAQLFLNALALMHAVTLMCYAAMKLRSVVRAWKLEHPPAAAAAAATTGAAAAGGPLLAQEVVRSAPSSAFGPP